MDPARARAELARVDAELAEARLRREDLQHQWATATYSLSRRRPADIDVDLARVDATIADLEAQRAELTGTAADPAPAAAQPAPTPEPEFVGTREAARLLGISPRTLEGLRARGEGPPHRRIGKRVLYPLVALRSLAK